VTHPLPRPRPLHRALLSTCAAAALLALPAAASTAALEELRRLVESGQHQQAFELAQRQPQLAGDVHFDFLYGVAAINAGRVPQGLLALERHLAQVPGNDRARLELAQGYFLLGDFVRARSEFEFVLRYEQPAATRERINRFLEAMQTRQAGTRRPAARLYAELGAGRDNNVNSGTFRDEVEFLFGGVQSIAGTDSQAVADDFVHLALGGEQQLRVSNRLSVFAGADLDQQRNREARRFDRSNASAYLGFSNLAVGALWRSTLTVGHLAVGDARYRDLLQLGTEATWSLSPDTQFMAFGQVGEQRFAGSEAVRDGRAVSVGAMLSHSPGGWPGQPSVGLRLAWVQENNLARTRDDLDKDGPLLRVFASVSPLPRVRLAVGAAASRQTWGDVDVIAFGTRRRDDYLAVDGVLSVAINARWSVRTEAQWSRTRSTQDVYDNSRKSAALKLRAQF
jgi:tetratricopeptide (TPR) repeat protein